MTSLRNRRIAEACILVLAGVLLLSGVWRLPGISQDEAWVLFRVHAISEGERPVAGMTFYTGAMYQYLVWPFLELFGYRIGVLRTIAGLCNLTGLFLAIRLVARLDINERAHLWFGLLLGTTPIFVLLGRFGVELTSLGFLLTSLGLWSTVRALQTSGGSRIGFAALGGLSLGLAVYNHFLMIVVSISLGLSLLLVYRRAVLTSPVTWWCLLGFFVGWGPQLFLMLAGESQTWADAGQGMAAASEAVITTRLLGELPHLPEIVARNWDGALVYRRFAGPNWIWVVPYPVLVLLTLLFFQLRVGAFRRKPSRTTATVILFLVLVLLGTVTISTGLSTRFFVVPISVCPLLLVIAASKGAGIGSRAAPRLLACVALLNMGYLATNFFVDYTRTQGVVSVYPLGNQLIESSTTFVNTDELYHELVEADVELILANETIAGPLMVHDWDQRRLNVRFWRLATSPPSDFGGAFSRVAVVYHNGPISWNRATEVFDISDIEEIQSDEVIYRLDPRFDEHFRVFVLSFEP